MPLKIGDATPDFAENASWLSAEKRGTAIKGVALFYFWAMSCPSCKHNMSALQALRDRYHHCGLQVVAVHTPRNEEDRAIECVRRMATELGITEPCAIDNDHAIGNAFETGGVWPIYFLFDGGGKLRCRAAGGFGVKMMERTLARMFPDAPVLEKPECPCSKNGAGDCCQDS